MAIKLLRPPRAQDDTQATLQSYAIWFDQVYRALAIENDVLTAAQQAQADTFNAANLPDPASTNLAQAQQTANEAYTLADLARDKAVALEGRLPDSARVTLSDPDTNFDYTFSTAQADTDYYVDVTASAFTGAAAASAFIVTNMVRATDKVTITVGAAPGAGATITFDCSVRRNA